MYSLLALSLLRRSPNPPDNKRGKWSVEEDRVWMLFQTATQAPQPENQRGRSLTSSVKATPYQRSQRGNLSAYRPLSPFCWVSTRSFPPLDIPRIHKERFVLYTRPCTSTQLGSREKGKSVITLEDCRVPWHVLPNDCFLFQAIRETRSPGPSLNPFYSFCLLFMYRPPFREK